MAIIIGKNPPSTGGGGGGSGGTTETLDNITGGPLSTTKGGTGFNASSLSDLRSRLGISSNHSDATTLLYCKDTLHQQRDTIERTDDSTSNRPDSDNTADGIIVKTGNDQIFINLEDGKEWRRGHTDTRGEWSTPVTPNPVVPTITTGTDFAALSHGAVRQTTATAFLPRFTDNSQPAKAIISRNDNYMIAADRYNMWFAERPTGNNWSSIDWKWEGNNRVPSNLRYTGGEHDEELIPVNESAILAGKTGIDGEEYITLMVSHTFESGSSKYNGYFIDDDANKTVKESTNTRGYTVTDWKRTKLDIDGIADTIITADRDTGDPVFHGIIPEISSMGFPGYRFRTGTQGLSQGDVRYTSSSRTVYVYHKELDVHLQDLFHPDFEIEIRKDDDNYIRGVFEQVSAGIPLPGNVTLTGALFRSEDLKEEGTITSGDTVEIKGHKSVITKDDTILPVNLGLAHGTDAAGKIVRMDSTGDSFELAEPSGLPTGAQIPSTTINKSESLTLIASGTPGPGEILLPTAANFQYRASDAPPNTNLLTIINAAANQRKFVLIVKDSNNYMAFKPSSNVNGTHAAAITIHDYRDSRVQKGTIGVGDTVRLWVQPDNAGKHIVHDFLGESIVIEPERPHLIYVRQSTGITSPASSTDWNWIVTTPPWKIPAGFKVGGHIEVKGGGVANFGAGNAEQIVPELMVQHRSGNTLANTSSATWRNLDINDNIDAQGIKLLFRSKVSSGGATGADRFRDYWAYASKPMPMSEMHSDCVDGNYVQFQLGLRRANSSNPAITSIYGFDMTIHVWPPSLVTTS